MRRFTSLFAVMGFVILTTAGAFAQTISATTYPFTSSTGVTLEDMSTGTTTLVAAASDDGSSGLTPIGFDFWFVGIRQTQFVANANGFVRLGGTISGSPWVNGLTTTTNVPEIAAYWDDLWVGTNGKVHYKVVGSAPTRKLVVEWQNMTIPRQVAATTGAATFQLWLSESSGLIEYVYGSGMATNTANAGASIGFNTSASLYASVKVAGGPTVTYGTAVADTNTIPIASGTKYRFTPPTPVAPSGLSFTSITQTAMTLNWTDNSSNEVGFAIYRSDDGGTTYNFVIQAAANAISSAQSGLLPGITYFWNVYAVTEGSLSSPLSGSQASGAAGTKISAATGNWNNPLTWSPNGVPTSTDDVTIQDADAVTIDVNAVCNSLTVGQGAGGTLTFDGTARTLTVTNGITVAVGGNFNAGAANIIHAIQVGGSTATSLGVGSLAVNGTLDLYLGASSGRALLRFFGSPGAAISGTGATCDFFYIDMNKGATAASSANTPPILDMQRTFTVQGANTVGFLATHTAGTLKISGAYTLTNPLDSIPSYTIPLNGGFWLSNPNFTVAGQTGSPAISGLLKITSGTLNIGTSNNSMGFNSGSTIIVEGGFVNSVSRFGVAAATNSVYYNQSGGTLTLCTAVAGNTSTTLAAFDLGTSAGTLSFFSGGTIILQAPGTGASGPRDYRLNALQPTFTGGTLQVGNSATAASSTFFIQGYTPHIVVDNTTNSKTAYVLATTIILGNLTVNSGSTVKDSLTILMIGSTVTNNGAIVSTGGTGSRFDFQGTGAQTYGGSGTFGTVVAPFGGVGVSVSNTAGATLNSPIITNRVNLFSGSFTNSNQITIGNAAATTGVIQRGGNGGAAPAGSFDVAPTFNVGTGGLTLIYSGASTTTTTSFEIPASRTIGSLSLGGAVPATNVTLAGGNLTLSQGTTPTLTFGVNTSNFDIGSNNLTIGLDATKPGTITYTAGQINMSTGSLTRWFPNAGLNTTIANGGVGHFPIASSGNNRNVWLAFTSAGALTTGGTVTVSHATGTGVTGTGPYADGGVSVDTRSNGSWTMSQSGLALAGVDSILARIQGSSMAMAVGSVANLRFVQSGGAVGTSLVGTGTATDPQVNRRIGVAELSNTNYIGGNAADLGALITWVGGSGNWSDPTMWSSNPLVPTSTDNVQIAPGAAATITVDASFAVNDLTIGTNATINLGASTLTVNRDFVQSAGTLSLGSGTLDVKRNFTRSGGTYTASTSLTRFSGAVVQTIDVSASGTTFNNVTFTGGGAGFAKTFTAARTLTANGNYTVETTAQLNLTAATATTHNIAGNFAYSGLTGASNIGSLTVNLTGTGKTIDGSVLARPTFTSKDVSLDGVTDTRYILIKGLESENARAYAALNEFSEPIVEKVALGKNEKTELPKYYTSSRAKNVLERIFASQQRNERITVVLEDGTIVKNPPVWGDRTSVVTSPFEFAVTVAATGSYTLNDNIAMASARTLSINGILNAGTSTIGGAGNVTVTGASGDITKGVIGTGNTSAAGYNNVIVAGTVTYTGDAIVEYNALGSQTVNTASHPLTTMIQTGGTGTKTLNGNIVLSGSSAGATTKGILYVKSGSTFADGGFTITSTTTGFGNIVVEGSYLSTSSGAISYESGPTVSKIRAADGTVFGDFKVNFGASSSTISLESHPAATTVGMTFRNMTFGGTAGSGVAGGTLVLSSLLGTTNVTVTGNVSLSPLTLTNTGGGFNGTSAKTTLVKVAGDIISTSTSSTQPIMSNTGTNVLEMNGSVLQTIAAGASTTFFTGATLRINNASNVKIGTGTGNTYTMGGTLDEVLGSLTIGTFASKGPSGTKTSVVPDVFGYTAGATLKYSGAGAQSTAGEFPAASGPTNLTIAKSSGNLNLTASRSLTGVLTFTSGNIVTGANTLILTSSASVSRTSGHVEGFLKKNVAVGSDVSRMFEVGTGADFTPVGIHFASVSTGGDLVVTSISGDHPNIGTASLDPSKSLNRYYNITNSGVVFTTSDDTLHFVPTDVDGPANTANFKVRKYDSPNWTTPTTANPLATSIVATGVTGFSDFAVAEALPPQAFILISPDSNVTNVPTNGQLLWQKSAGASTYDVYLDTLLVPTLYASTADTFKSYAALQPFKKYYWKVTASGVEPPPYSTDTTSFTTAALPPASPDSMLIYNVTPDSLTISFRDRSTNEEGFKIQRSLTYGSGYVQVDSVGPLADTMSVVTYTDKPLVPNTEYFYRAIAFNSVQGNSNPAEEDSTTLARKPGAPALSNFAATSMKITLSPNGNSAPTEFVVRVDDGVTPQYMNASGVLVGSEVWDTYANFGGAGGKTLTGITSLTSYTVDVKARNADNIQTAYSTSTSSPPGSPSNALAVPTGPIAPEATIIQQLDDASVLRNSKEFTDALRIGREMRGQRAGGGSLKLESMAAGINLSFTDNAASGPNSEDSFYVYAKLGSAPATGGHASPDFLAALDSSTGSGATVNYVHSGIGYNQHWFYKVSSKNANGESVYDDADTTTYVNTPGAPTFASVAWNRMNVIVALNGNPGTAEQYAIFETSTAKYLTAAGTLTSVPEVWQTYTQWGGASGKLVTGLTRGTLYSFKVKARNGNNIESIFGSTASQATTFDQPISALSENFSGAFPPAGWTRLDEPTVRWLQGSAVGPTGVADTSAVYNFFNASAGEKDTLITPSLNLGSAVGATLNWYHSYRSYSGESDSMFVLVSSNGGTTWNTIASDGGATMHTVATDTLASWFPTSSTHWRLNSLVVPNIYLSSTVKFAWYAKSAFGNLYWLDNILLQQKVSPNTITVRSLKDADGSFGTSGDRTSKKWYLALNDSATGGLVASGNLDSIVAINLLDGTYIASEADSIGWSHIGKIRNGTPVATSVRFDTIRAYGGAITWATDFVNYDSPDPAAPCVIYSSTSKGDTPPGRLLSVNTVTGVGTLLGTITTAGVKGVPALAIRSDGAIFGMKVDDGSGANDSLYRIDGLTGNATFVAGTGLGFVDAIAYSPDDVLYGVSQGDAGLYTINDVTGAATLVGITGNTIAGLAFDPTNGKLYASKGGLSGTADRILTLDPATGAATIVGFTGLSSGAVPDIAFDCSGNLFGTKGGGNVIDTLISINKLTGAGAYIMAPGPIGFKSVSGMASLVTFAPAAYASSLGSIAFGNVLKNDCDVDSVTITNSGAKALNVSSMALVGSGMFSVTPPAAPFVLLGGQSKKFYVQFCPTASGAQAGHVIFTHNGTSSPDSVHLSGTGVQSVFASSADSVNFGNVLKNECAYDTLFVKNSGGSVLTIDSSVAYGGEFCVNPGGLVSILPGDSAQYVACFCPTASGVQNGYVLFYSTSKSSPDTLYLTGTGIQSTFAAAPGSLPFGTVTITTSATDTVTVTNNGGAALLIDSVRSTNGTFVVSPNGSFSVPGSGGTKKYAVTFTPADTTSQSGNIIWYSDAKSSPDSVAASGTGVVSPSFTTVSPDSIAALDGAGKLVKAAKRKKGKYPNWTNLLEEVVAQGGFSPKNGATETDSAGGEVIGISFMFKKNPADTLAPKWTQIKQTGKSDTAWARLSAWDFKKNKGKSASQISKTMRNKTFNHWTSDPTSTPRGFDSTLVPGVIKRKQMKKQMTKLDPKKTPNKLYSELVALKFNIASSQLGNTPQGFGDLIYDVDSSMYDEMSLLAISQRADTMMTFWKGVDSTVAGDSTKYAQLYQAVYDVNRAFIGVLDTANFENIDSSVSPAFIRLRVNGNVNIASVSFLKEGALRPTAIRPTSHDTETEEDFEDGDYFDDYESEDGEGTPVAAKLYQNYPNPFNPTTTVSFRLLAPSLVTLKVYNVLGQEVATLLNGDQMDEGYQTVQFNPAGLSSGVYFYQINVQSEDGELARTLETKKMLLIK